MPNEPVYSIIVPVYNSESTLHELHRRLVATLEALGEPFELVFCEDCGPDGSWNTLKLLAGSDHRVKAIQLMKNSGQGNATLAGMERACGRFIITLDDDLQHPPEELPAMIRALQEDADCDVIIGTPVEKKHHWMRRLGSASINRLNTWSLGKALHLRFTGFRVMRSNVAHALLRQNVPYPALGPMLISNTSRIRNLPVRHDARARGRSGYTFGKIFKQTLSNLIGYSILPLHVLAAVGALGILLSVAASCYFMFRYFTQGIGVPGWMTLLLTLLGLSGFNFFAFGILGEYILRISQTTERAAHRNARVFISGGLERGVG